MRQFCCILFVLFFANSKAQLLYYQSTYKGGISYDGRSYEGFDYLQPDTIVFQNSISAGSTFKKAYLISQRLNSWVVGSTPIADIPLQLVFNGNNLIIDSADIVANYYNCDYSTPSEPLSTVVKDVTTFAIGSNNKLITPCQSCNTLVGQAVYDGFYLVLLYTDNNMPPINTAIFLNNQTDNVTMLHNFTRLNPINIGNDVGLSITNNCASRLFNYQCSYSLNSGINTYFLGTIYSSTDSGMNKLPGSFYYQNNALVGLVDDINSPFIDSTDALCNIKTYLPNNTTTFSLTSTGNVSGACDDERLVYILAYTTPCPARSNKDTVISYTICSGANVQLNGTSSGTYTWSAPSNSLNHYNIANPIASPTVTTNYIALVDSNGCKHTEQFKVNVYTTPKTDSVRTIAAICGGTAGTATIVADVGSPTSYTVNGTVYHSPVISNLATGTYTFALSNSFGCSYTSPKTFIIKDTNLAKAGFYITPTSGCEPLSVYGSNLSNNTNAQVWYMNGDSANTQNLSYTFTDTGRHTIILFAYETLRQCSATTTQTVIVKYCPPDSIHITVPNVFSPNGDNINDTWQLLIYNYNYTISNYQCTIYDRWGIKVFAATNPSDGWSGKTTSGEVCSEGAYFYVIKLTATNSLGKTDQKEFKGFLELVR
ncbi:MAG: gliding motility-associated C-terminal domain-containing protein [Bacteroidia bacterium]